VRNFEQESHARLHEPERAWASSVPCLSLSLPSGIKPRAERSRRGACVSVLDEPGRRGDGGGRSEKRFVASCQR
jgi:hypothetical protein